MHYDPQEKCLYQKQLYQNTLKTPGKISETLKILLSLNVSSFSGQNIQKHPREPSDASSVDSNTSLSVWSNLHLVWLIDEFLCGGASIETSMDK